MKRNLLLLLSALLLAGAAASAQSVQTLDDSKYSLSAGDVTMTVDAGRGGKILSFRLGDEEILNQGRFPNSFGSTFWTSPQSEWNWPPVAEYDTKPFEASVQDGRLVLNGQKSERFGYRIRKEFSTDPKDGAFVITYTILNESGQTRKVAPWEISRVANGGLLFFEAKSVEPANNMAGLPFTFEKKGAWYVMDEAKENRKINADGTGWLAFANGKLLFIKKFQDLKAGEEAPAEAEIQIYANPGKTFVEVEEQGPYTTLEDGASVSWTVRWYLLPYDGALTPSKALLKKARRIVR
ncbi:MAG: hypothetical protein IJU34_03615 [Bacteroidales bacterium]|nr:hypothetical protein [Bacteroidales bacterium]